MTSSADDIDGVDRVHTAHSSERDDLLDFPGADELVAAGAVAPPAPQRVTAVREVLALLAEREAERTHASAHALVVSGPSARRGRPEAALAPPEDTLVVIGGARRPGAPHRRVSRRRRVLIAGAAVAAFAAGAVAYPVLDLGGKPASTSSPASRFLKEMAEVSEDAPGTRGPYWRVTAVTVTGGKPREETWWADREGRTWRVDKNGKAYQWENHASWRVGDRRLTWPDLDELPTDPDALTAHFPEDAEARFFQIVNLLDESPASPALRSALFQVVAELPGVELEPGVKDSRGRSGTAITIPTKVLWHSVDGGEPTVVWHTARSIIDPSTGWILESSGTALGENRVTVLTAGPADRIG
ncbi:CU044_5270 family protein [Streptomyces sp. NPDC014892]|uniref:CU044_5270 family protein n=1 Tax=Streptomyces sp. NPDC014892 TaxID=3364930 RepID=UPI0036F942DA